MHSSVLALSSTWKIAPHSIGDNRIGGSNIFLHCLILHSFVYFHAQLYPCIIIAEANSTAQNFVDFTEAEEDLVSRMHRLVGNRWELIAGRIPGRTAEEVEMFWSKKHQEKWKRGPYFILIYKLCINITWKYVLINNVKHAKLKKAI